MDIGSPLEPRLLELLSLHKVGTLIKTQKENPEPKRCFPPQLKGDVDKIPPQKEESHLQHWLRFGEEGLWCCGFSRVAVAFSSYDGDLSLPLGLALGSPIFPSGCEGKLGVALESLQGLRDLT